MKRLYFFLCAFAVFALISAQPRAWAMAKKPPLPKERPVHEAKPKVTIDFQKAYQLALPRSETIFIAREEIAKAYADWMIASGEGIGDGDFVTTDFFQQEQGGGSSGASSVGSTLTATERRERKFTFSQPIFQGFKTMGAVAGAGSLTKQRKEEYQRSKEVLFLEVTQFFYGLLLQRKDVETMQGIHDLLEERIGELKEREKIGRSRPSEVVTAIAKVKALEAQLAQTRGALAIAENIMEFYTGIPKEQADYQEGGLPSEKPLAPSDYGVLAEQRHDVKAAYQAAKTARQALVVAQSSLWPKITMDANHYEKREGFQSGIDWDVLFKVNVPLFRGGDSIGRTKRAYSDWKQAKLNYSLTKRKAELAIKEAYQNWLSSQEQNQAFQAAVSASQDNYRIQKEDYTRSLVNNLDVLSALEELFSTSREANRAHFQLAQSYWNFKTSVGDCCHEGFSSGSEKMP